MENELLLTDLIDTEVLQRIQDGFAAMTGMAALTTDVNGKPVTQGSRFTDFCTYYTRNSVVGRARCEQCDRHGAEETRKNGRPEVYYCHAGLMDFSAPIMANDKLVGCFIGGQVLVKPIEDDYILDVAKEIEVDPQEYLKAAKKVNIRNEEEIERAAEFLYIIASVLSDMAYGKHMALLAGEEMERAANMKSDFLANMSHEIRTPMNAVIGMAEMALREDISEQAREYIMQIKNSGRTMLRIINDILDFSKIESGKMDINLVEYEYMSVLNDIVNIIVPRLKDKDIELILDIKPDIPCRLYGDNIRIKQVLINLINNAVKFTKNGAVTLRIRGEAGADNTEEIYVEVEDTGIGIKKEDVGKLFQSFQQLDSKRNRNIEGTGLGLAISKKLLQLMDGSIRVESEYGKGSTFFAQFPQQVIDTTAGASVRHPENIFAVNTLLNPYVKQQLNRDLSAFHISYTEDVMERRLHELGKGKERFLFLEPLSFDVDLEEFAHRHEDWTIVLVADYFDSTQYAAENLIVVKKPLYTLNLSMILNREKVLYTDPTEDTPEFKFIAPEAEILVVDDNSLNLTVVKGLLEPLKMQIDTASGGKEAIDMISEKHYDIIFMDHMMPGIDGVETTHIIRQFYKDYDATPIIALTANAVEGTKEMFLKEGMNDFVPKPIELRLLIAKVRQWLPVEKIQQSIRETDTASEDGTLPVIGDLDTEAALKLLGSRKLFFSILKDYYRSIEKKSADIMFAYQAKDYAAYTIDVHALKSSSKQIGAMQLSKMAAELEKAGNARNTKYMKEHTEETLQKYREYLAILEPYAKEEDAEKKERLSDERRLQLFAILKEAVDNLDMDGMQQVADELKSCIFTGAESEKAKKLIDAIEEMDVDICLEIMDSWGV